LKKNAVLQPDDSPSKGTRFHKRARIRENKLGSNAKPAKGKRGHWGGRVSRPISWCTAKNRRWHEKETKVTPEPRSKMGEGYELKRNRAKEPKKKKRPNGKSIIQMGSTYRAYSQSFTESKQGGKKKNWIAISTIPIGSRTRGKGGQNKKKRKERRDCRVFFQD